MEFADFHGFSASPWLYLKPPPREVFSATQIIGIGPVDVAFTDENVQAAYRDRNQLEPNSIPSSAS